MIDRLFTDDLEAACTCGGDPDLTHEHVTRLTSNCHPGTGLLVDYRRGVLELDCARCGNAVVEVVVGSRPVN